jgi:hypothetical protein
MQRDPNHVTEVSATNRTELHFDHAVGRSFPLGRADPGGAYPIAHKFSANSINLFLQCVFSNFGNKSARGDLANPNPPAAFPFNAGIPDELTPSAPF